MPRVHYDDDLTLRAARARYFAENGLADGGYDDRWVVFRAGGVPIAAIPNSSQRVRSVRLHDAHHVLTGYDTSWLGEAEIGAWELASHCRDHHAAWLLNASAVLIGCFISPSAVRRAWRRGRSTRNLYGGEWDDALLDERVGALRARLGLS